MLDDDAGRRLEGLDAFQCGIGIGDVVERQFLALDETCGGDDAAAGAGFDEQRAGLMRIFTVTQGAAELEGGVQAHRPGGRCFRRLGTLGQPLGDLAVVGARMRIGFRGPGAALRCGTAAVVQRIDEAGVIGRIGQYGHARMVFCGGAQHGRSADVDVLDGVVVAAVGLGDGGRERIQIHHQQIDGFDAVLGTDRVIGAGTREQAAVDFRMQGFHPSVHDFRKAGDSADIGDGQTGVAQGLGGTAGGQQLHAMGDQRFSQRQQAGFIGHRQQGAADGMAGCGHRSLRKGLNYKPSA